MRTDRGSGPIPHSLHHHAKLGGTRARNVALRANAAAWARLAKLAAQGVLKPHVERRIGLAEVAAAQAAMATGHGRGKTVVVPAE